MITHSVHRLQLKSCYMSGIVLDMQTHTHGTGKEELKELWEKEDRLFPEELARPHGGGDLELGFKG